ncbi:uncharacterized protein LOC120350168 [Nilaparvata lugens]|uniref:uncharacterized protein LOC120350168 n=1 Tax=Nilaparvata lugens TaxID=108931 RepID=UPI00193E8047|nr:uncharacterized protein LOC120350168 [Nilaparvata lugens]
MREARKQGVERSPFVDLHNIQIPASPSKARTQSTSSSPANARFEFFRKEGEKLDRNAKLVQCPRCMLPARCGQGGNYDNLGECVSVCHARLLLHILHQLPL